MRYTGEKCPVCNMEFTADDDIVVCPECGTPHHRECYMAGGRCANEELHAKGEKWEKRTRRQSFRSCPSCHFPNKYTDTLCSRCGAELTDDTTDSANNSTENGQQIKDPFSAHDAEDLMNPIKFLGLDPEEDMGGATMKEVTDFVGTSAIYYIPKFRQMKENGVKPTFNLFSFFFPSFFFANRKMWGWAVLAAVLGVIFNLPENLLVGVWSLPKDIAAFVSDNKPVMEKWRDIMVAVDLVLRVLSCFFANWLYYRFSMNSIRRLKKADRKEADIKAAGGVKPINMVLVMLIKYGVIVVLYMCYEMITAMRDFSTL